MFNKGYRIREKLDRGSIRSSLRDGGLQHFSVSIGFLVFGFWGLVRVWGKGLTKFHSYVRIF